MHRYSQITEDLKAIPDTPAFYEVNNFPFNPPDHQQLKSYILSCSCVKFRKGTTCPCHSIRQSTTHDFQLKAVLDSLTDEALKNCDLTKLTIPRLKTELLSRSLSTSHKLKAELVQRLQNYLKSVV